MIALSIKDVWAAGELTYLRSVADAPRRTFATAAEATQAHLRFCGLQRAPGPERLGVGGVCETKDGWATTFDPNALRLVEDAVTVTPDLTKAPVTIAVGGDDQLIGARGVAALLANGAEVIPNAGHNVHVERPGEVWRLIQKVRDKH